MKNNYKYSNAGLSMTKAFEGLRLIAYQDVAGVWTIGYGSTFPVVTPGETITEQETVDFGFNYGQGNYKGSTYCAK